MLVDTHTHLYSRQFDSDRQLMVERALAAGVEAMYLPNIDKDSVGPMLALEEAWPGRCVAMMGLHPCSVGPDFRQDLDWVFEWLQRRPFCAVGEIGIDLYWDKTYVEQQKEAFLQQTRWALERNLPIVIHSRESMDLILELLLPFKGSGLRGVFHCFTGNLQQAEAAIAFGFMLGIGGVLTYKNSGLDQVLQRVDLRRLVLETDAPYLAPVPFRGKRNESAYITKVAERLAQIKELSIEEIGRITTANAYELFGKPEAFMPGEMPTRSSDYE